MCVIGAIEPSLRKAETDRVRRQRPTNLSAYDLVLRSLPFVLGHIPRDSEVAIPLLQDALKLQLDYASAHAFLGRCFHHRYARAGLLAEDRIAAIQHAHAAIAYGSDDATALAAAAHVIALDEHDTATALRLFDRALELSNSNVFALNFSAIILAWMGKTELAIERAQLALRLSPFDFYSFAHTTRWQSRTFAASDTPMHWMRLGGRFMPIRDWYWSRSTEQPRSCKPATRWRQRRPPRMC